MLQYKIRWGLGSVCYFFYFQRNIVYLCTASTGATKLLVRDAPAHARTGPPKAISRDSVYILSILGCCGFGVAVVLASACGDERDGVTEVEVLGLELQYISEHIMNIKKCPDARAALPWLFAVCFTVILWQWRGTFRAWGRYQHAQLRSVGSLELWLTVCGLGMWLVVAFDHVGDTHEGHVAGVLLLFLGLIVVHVQTLWLHLNHNATQILEREPSPHAQGATPAERTLSEVVRSTLIWSYLGLTTLCVVAGLWFIGCIVGAGGNDNIYIDMSVCAEYFLVLFIALLVSLNLFELLFLQSLFSYDPGKQCPEDYHS